jgi:MoxR-like ATPase
MRDAASLLTPAEGRPYAYHGEPLDMPRAIEALKGALLHVSEALPGRLQLLQQTALALLTRRHQLLISRAGTGKSLYGDSVFSQFEGDIFKAQFSQGTRLETILGGLDLKQFHEGRLWHNTAHSLVTADFAYLDEFMNANDVVLEAILGILNERRFQQGEQQEEARLHTALAMTNHLKFTAISEPILDRFMFKASIDPAGDALNDILIDLAYARHHGRALPPEHRIPLATLHELSAIVLGEHPDRHVEATHDILFLKNEVIDAYVTRYAARRPAQANGARPATDGYVSPRTKAACRDVLNASALLHHRDQVERTDLAALRFVLTIIPGNDRALHDPGQDIFAEALQSTLQGYSESDLETVRELTAIAQSFHFYIHGIPIESQPAHRGLIRFVLALIGKSNWHDVTDDTFLQALRARTITNPRVNALREEILEEVLEHRGG